ncbi:hypothetical protein CNECB9_4240004 [Cupriavidus necator]|uniref:Enoyl-CoA hydratase n=1 Tax=Cupriavidus necator TaxID=106590 RepID=A0A1K0JJ77_CUPNE|nr:hypothetical protein CNECB9_4240004 [Cupriavidus necator]
MTETSALLVSDEPARGHQRRRVRSACAGACGNVASGPPVAVRLIKEAALAGGDAPLATGLLLERRSFELLFDIHDQKEGMNAFIQRRAAVFSGH